MMTGMRVHGLLLAAGSGRRMGGPKALLRTDDGESYVERGVRVLTDGGCDRVLVVLGAAADEVEPLVEKLDVDLTIAADWAEGMGASLRAGLADPSLAGVDAVVVGLVDLPDVDASVVRRLLEKVAAMPDTLARASYDGHPGHPVLIGREHWAGVVETAEGDRGARTYLRTHPPLLVECGDLATGRDVDTPDAL
jgi:molybdenum cofactor cytidylyltransferase/nicotine blue oxidoreductase